MKPKKAAFDRERLLYRRQFILGPSFLDGFPTWNRVSIRPNVRVTVHPDLPVLQARRGNKSIVLLGYILDPYEPKASDAEVVNRLLTSLDVGTPEATIRETYPLGGRWILIADSGETILLFNDPVGYRQVFYARGPSDGLWCASQPERLAEALGLTADRDALAFIRACRRQDPQYWWLGDSTLYQEVRHLLPNHSLDLSTGAVQRFWPDRELPARTPEEVVEENAWLLQRLVESASHRFELALAITAGGDTRLLLAASKAIRHRLHCFTMIFWDLTWDSPDVQVPSRLLSRLGLPHHVIQCPPRMDKDFKEIYHRNVTTAHDVYGSHAQGLYNDYPTNKVCVKGTVIPLTSYPAELRRWLKRAAQEVNPHTLLWLVERCYGFSGERDFALEVLDRWLAGVNHSDIDPLYLFYWENREGNWAAMIQSEWDIVQETFVPFNCRLFLINMLSVPESVRAWPSCLLQTKLTHRLWPEVMSEPINPPEKPTVLSAARAFLKSPGRKDVRWLYSHTVALWRERER